MSWEGADGEDSLKATLMCPAELQCQERQGWRRVLMVVDCVKHVFLVAFLLLTYDSFWWHFSF